MTPLYETGRAVADANGRAVVNLANLRAFVRWKVIRYTVSSTSVSETTAKVYRSHESPSMMLEGTYSGRQDASDTDTKIGTGESLLCVWSGATAGASCVFTIEGEQYR